MDSLRIYLSESPYDSWSRGSDISTEEVWGTKSTNPRVHLFFSEEAKQFFVSLSWLLYTGGKRTHQTDKAGRCSKRGDDLKTRSSNPRLTVDMYASHLLVVTILTGTRRIYSRDAQGPTHNLDRIATKMNRLNLTISIAIHLNYNIN